MHIEILNLLHIATPVNDSETPVMGIRHGLDACIEDVKTYQLYLARQSPLCRIQPILKSTHWSYYTSHYSYFYPWEFFKLVTTTWWGFLLFQWQYFHWLSLAELQKAYWLAQAVFSYTSSSTLHPRHDGMASLNDLSFRYGSNLCSSWHSFTRWTGDSLQQLFKYKYKYRYKDTLVSCTRWTGENNHRHRSW